MAFAVAALADGLSFFLMFTPPVQWVTDLVAALMLFMVLGRQWILLPGLVLEAIPGLGVVPFWVLVVAAVAMWGTPRPGGDLGVLRALPRSSAAAVGGRHDEGRGA